MMLVPPSLCILLPGTCSLVTPSQRIKTVLGPGTSVPRSSARSPHDTRSRHPSLPLPIVSYAIGTAITFFLHINVYIYIPVIISYCIFISHSRPKTWFGS
ncbi:hypothetical protein C8R48DRAFT_724246 [Suillus tomentosus]|nr:hypothetical protein C8R48DRAFT_724246 [Suillus tomentosus]